MKTILRNPARGTAQFLFVFWLLAAGAFRVAAQTPDDTVPPSSVVGTISIRFVGAANVDEQVIRANMQVHEGSTFDETLVDRDIQGGQQRDVYQITNISTSIIDTNLLMIAQSLPSGVLLIGRHTGVTSNGDPYLRIFLTNGVLLPGQSTVQTLNFKVPQGAAPVSYNLDLRSGQGNP